MFCFKQKWNEMKLEFLPLQRVTPRCTNRPLSLLGQCPQFSDVVPIARRSYWNNGTNVFRKNTNTYFFVKCLFSVWFFHYVITCNGMCYTLSPVFDIVFSDNYRACCTRLNRSCLTGLLITNLPKQILLNWPTNYKFASRGLSYSILTYF